MEANISYLGMSKFAVEARGHRVICDQPVDNGGGDEGLTPPEFLLASLGTCAGFYAVQYLRTRSLPTVGLAVRVTARKEKPPARLAAFRIELRLPPVDERHQDGVVRAVKSCLIHHTLLHPPEMAIAVETDVPATV